MSTITVTDVVNFLKTADEVDRNIIRATLGEPFRLSQTDGYKTAHTVDDLMKPNMLAPHGLERKQARMVQAAQVLGQLIIGDIVKFPYNSINYEGQITKINRTTAKVRIMKMDGPPTKKGVVVGAVVGVPASILARK
jgi:hypothetical protein